MSNTMFAGTIYSTINSAARAWAETALPDTSVIGREEDSTEAAQALEAYWWGEAQRIGEGAPEDTDETEWRDACRAALQDRINRSR